MIYKFLNLGFPVYLVLFEMSIRALLKIESSSIIGPALAASGLSLIISALKDKKIDIEPTILEPIKTHLATSQGGKEILITTQSNNHIREIALLCLLLGLWGWCTVCVKSLLHDPNDMFILRPTILGFFMYLVGIVVLTIKERD